MDLLGILRTAGTVVDLLGGGPGSDCPWATDEKAFLRHFGIAHEDYIEITKRLSNEQHDLLHRTLNVNPEAAVLWILSMEEVEE